MSDAINPQDAFYAKHGLVGLTPEQTRQHFERVEVETAEAEEAARLAPYEEAAREARAAFAAAE